MSDAVLALRELALSRLTADHPVHIVLDDDLRAELVQVQSAVATIEAHRAQLERDGNLPPKPVDQMLMGGSLADPTPEPVAPTAEADRLLTAAREAVAAIEAEALESGKVLVLHFQRVSEVSYQNEVRAAEKSALAEKGVDQNAAFVRGLGDALLPLCYVSASTPDGEDVGLTLDELREQVLNHADVAGLRDHVIGINRARQAVPFTPRNSGAATTN